MGASEGCTLLLTNCQPHQIKHRVRHGLMIRLELACILPAKLRCCEFDGLHSELTVRLQLACEASLFRIVRSALQIADGDVANDCKPAA